MEKFSCHVTVPTSKVVGREAVCFNSFSQVKISTPQFDFNFQSRFGASECSKIVCGNSQSLNQGPVALLRGMQQHQLRWVKLASSPTSSSASETSAASRARWSWPWSGLRKQYEAAAAEGVSLQSPPSGVLLRVFPHSFKHTSPVLTL